MRTSERAESPKDRRLGCKLALALPSVETAFSIYQHVPQIFGATGHMGHSLMRAVLAHNDNVTAVGWAEENTAEEMDRMNSANCQGLLCDVRVRCTVDRVIKKAKERWGKLDIVVK
jgi:NADP-dependent 3-hydroxy acid dehydrogenase YdfG